MARSTAFEILYREYYARVFGLCRRLLNSGELAEDAAQEAFMRAYKAFGKYDPEQPFWQWIAAIANHHCIDLIRRQSRADALFGDEAGDVEQLSTEQPMMLSELISAEEAGFLNDAIGRLPDRYRIPVVLAYFNQSSYDQIAEQLGISRNHVGVLLLRAKQKLRADLDAGEEGR